jgi:transposase
MAGRRVKVRLIRQILNYRLGKGVSADQTARALKLSKGTVINTMKRFSESGLPWPLPEELTDSVLEGRLYPPQRRSEPVDPALPSSSYVEQELAKKHVTLQCLYDEYTAGTSSPISRASFYRHYRRHRHQDPSFPVEHRGGDLVYVDYSGDGLSYTDRQTGKRHTVELFCCCWGLSSFSYAEVTESQKKLDFTQSHVRAFRYFGVVPHGLVPDNLKSAVRKACPFDPVINLLYAEMGRHYGTAILPARVRKPKDKAKIESGVLHIQRFILARLRNEQFFSLAQINEAIRPLLDELNDRPMKDYGYQSRRERFERLDLPHAQRLPAEPFRITAVKDDVLVGKNYHIRYDDHFYSVPFQYVGYRVTVRRSGGMVEIIYDNQLLTRHLYRNTKFRYSTKSEHMPRPHQFVKGLTPGWIIAQAAEIGENTVTVAAAIMRRCEHVQQGFGACLGVLSLAKAYNPGRLEAAARRCVHYNTMNYRSLKSVLLQKLDEQPLPDQSSDAYPAPDTPALMHENLRRDYGSQSERTPQ